jgi:predicted DNA-binding protein YlxM (UPF0122 family)
MSAGRSRQSGKKFNRVMDLYDVYQSLLTTSFTHGMGVYGVGS